MPFWEKIKQGVWKFMAGRYGADEFSRCIVIAGLILFVAAMLTGWGLLSLLATAMYIWGLFRMYSRNRTKRMEENARYLTIERRVRTSMRQFVNRLKNSKQYKYFRCPNCHARLRLPRGVGEVTVNCGQCKNSFRKKA